MVYLLTLTRAYMCARYLFRVDLTLNRAIIVLFATLTLLNELLVIIDQQKAHFITTLSEESIRKIVAQQANR